MIVAIKLLNEMVYIDKNIYSDVRFADVDLTSEPYNYTKVEVDDKYSDCIGLDFNDDLSFSVEKYNARKQKEINLNELFALQDELTSLSHDIIQAQVGAVIDNIEERKARFKEVHNRIREIMGKEPRVYDI